MMYGTPAVHSSTLLGGVPNLQFLYMYGLKPLANILGIRKAVTAQTQSYTTQVTHKSGLLSFYYLTHIPY